MPDCDYFLLYLALGKLSLMLLINYNYYNNRLILRLVKYIVVFAQWSILLVSNLANGMFAINFSNFWRYRS